METPSTILLHLPPRTGLFFVMVKDMPEKKSINVQEGKLNDKFTIIYQHSGIKKHVKKTV